MRGARGGAYHAMMEAASRRIIGVALDVNGWNVSATARDLGLSRVGLSKRLRALGLKRPAEKPQAAVAP